MHIYASHLTSDTRHVPFWLFDHFLLTCHTRMAQHFELLGRFALPWPFQNIKKTIVSTCPPFRPTKPTHICITLDIWYPLYMFSLFTTFDRFSYADCLALRDLGVFSPPLTLQQKPWKPHLTSGICDVPFSLSGNLLLTFMALLSTSCSWGNCESLDPSKKRKENQNCFDMFAFRPSQVKKNKRNKENKSNIKPNAVYQNLQSIQF